MTTTDVRVLPSYAAGAIDVPFAISRFHEQLDRNTQWVAHSHPTHELLWNERGVSTITVDSSSWVVTPTLGLWMPAGVLHSGAALAGTWCNFSHFRITTVPSISATPVAVEMTALLHLLLERLAEPRLSPASRRITEAAVLDVLTPMSQDMNVHVPQSPLLAPMVRAIVAEPGLQRPVGEWARLLSVSARTITRAFQAETGMGVAQWVARVRAQHAIPLLARGEELDEIAASLGYSSASAFGAAFKRTTGYTPRAFRQ